MSREPEAERLVSIPIKKVVAAGETGPGEIRNFILRIAGRFQPFLSGLIQENDFGLGREGKAPLFFFFSKEGPLLNRKPVKGEVLRGQSDRGPEALFPIGERPPRQAVD